MGSINHELKAIFIHTPKCGGLYISTVLEKFYNFKPLFSNNIFNNSTTGIKGKFAKFLSNDNCSVVKNLLYDMEDSTKNIFDSYFKFTFVRNPYTKLLSAVAYCSPKKCQNINDYLNFLKYLNENKQNSDNNTETIQKNINNNIFHSITSQTEHLQQTNVNYDFIGHFETLDNDLITVLLKLNVKIVHQRYLINNVVINSSKAEIDKNIDEKLLNYINELFSDDFKNFDYKLINNLEDYYTFISKKKDLKTERKLLIDKLISDGIIENPYEEIFQADNIYLKILKPEYILQKDDNKSSNTLYIEKEMLNNIQNLVQHSFNNITSKLDKLR